MTELQLLGVVLTVGPLLIGLWFWVGTLIYDTIKDRRP